MHPRLGVEWLQKGCSCAVTTIGMLTKIEDEITMKVYRYRYFEGTARDCIASSLYNQIQVGRDHYRRCLCQDMTRER